ncbi:hypothetical protein E2C01_093537 [Portunus trituberculatus]|uniref:Uncharacterized protein n=1 Tax=Portunus trituberculatus TaxID=210409 RepID=A0A5B7JUP1_PORTR|nr:hypothetical protein [Portunus trituberculatus]
MVTAAAVAAERECVIKYGFDFSIWRRTLQSTAWPHKAWSAAGIVQPRCNYAPPNESHSACPEFITSFSARVQLK